MDKMPPEHMELVLKGIEKVIKCRNCSKRLCPPLRFCETGHAFCSRCEHVTVCPNCSSCFPENQTTSEFIFQVLDALPSNPVIATNGQSPLLPSEPSLENLVPAFSQYRNVFCRIEECNWSGANNDLLPHLKIEHNSRVSFTSTYSSMTWSVDKIRTDKHTVYPIEGKNNLFWMHTKVDTTKQKLYIAFVHVPLTAYEVKSDYYAEVTLAKTNSSILYKYTQKVLNEKTDALEVMSNGNCMQVPLNDLSSLITDEEKVLMYHFKVFKFVEKK